jgi:hypothetical protein
VIQTNPLPRVSEPPPRYLCQRQVFFNKSYHPMPWRNSISGPVAPISPVAGGDNTTRPRRHGEKGF